MDKLYKFLLAIVGGGAGSPLAALAVDAVFGGLDIDAKRGFLLAIIGAVMAGLPVLLGASNTASPESLAQQVNRDTPAASKLRHAVQYQAQVMKEKGKPATPAATKVATGTAALLLALLLPLTACGTLGGTTHEPPIATQPQENTAVAASPNDLLAVAEVTFRSVVTGLRAARDAGLIERGGETEGTITTYINDGNDALAKSSAALTSGDLEGWAEWYGLAQGAIGFLQARLDQTG